jgi:outer membrane protein assembly factor BamB
MGGTLLALAPEGSEKWRLVLEKPSAAACLQDIAVGSDGTIYVVSAAVYAVNPDGFLKWKIEGVASQGRPVAVADNGNIYFIRAGILCMADAQGKVHWERSTGGPGGPGPIIGRDGTIYTGGVKHGAGTAQVHAFSTDGTLKWSFDIRERPFPTALAADDSGRVYSAVVSNLYALDADGTGAWVFKAPAPLWCGAAVGPNHVVYVGSMDGTLYAIGDRGEVNWKFLSKGAIASTPTLDSAGNIYFTSRDGNLYCLGSEGALRHVQRLTKGYGTPIISPNGIMYLQDAGVFYAIRALAGPATFDWPVRRHDASGTGRISSTAHRAAGRNAD